MDHTDSATFVIFDNNAATLFDMSCADMIHEMEIVCLPHLQSLNIIFDLSI
jgi:hypothetical protein